MDRDYLPLGCYGKLPFWPEYLRENVSQPSSKALVSWIHEGRGEAGLSLSGDGEATPPPRETARRRLLHGEVGSPEVVAGVVRPSADQGGFRTFPFLVLTHLPRRLYGGSYSLLPLALAPVWDALDDAWEALAAVVSREAFREVISSLRIPPPAPAREVEEAYRARQQEIPGALQGRADGASAEWLAPNMPEVLACIRRGTGPLRLELPVSSDPEAACLDASFWTDLLSVQFRFRKVEPSIFLDHTPGQVDRNVLLAFPPLTPGDYPVVMGCEGPGSVVLRPAHPAQDQAAPPAGEGRPEATYAELLARRFPAAR